MEKLDEKSINEKNNEKYKRPDSQMPVRTGYDYPVIFCALICWIADPMTIQFPVMPF